MNGRAQGMDVGPRKGYGVVRRCGAGASPASVMGPWCINGDGSELTDDYDLVLRIHKTNSQFWISSLESEDILGISWR